MLIVISQIVVLVTAILLPFIIRKRKKAKVQYKIDTDTSNSEYAVNEFGILELISRIDDYRPEVGN